MCAASIPSIADDRIYSYTEAASAATRICIPLKESCTQKLGQGLLPNHHCPTVRSDFVSALLDFCLRRCFRAWYWKAKAKAAAGGD